MLIPNQEGEGGAPPEQERTPFLQGQIKEMGESTPDLQMPHIARQSGIEGTTRERRPGRGCGEGAPPPLEGRGTPEDQAWRIVAQIINQPPGRSAPISQSPAPHR